MTSGLENKRRRQFPTGLGAVLIFVLLLTHRAIADNLPQELYSEGARILGGHANIVSRREWAVRMAVIGSSHALSTARETGEDAASIANLPFSVSSSSPVRAAAAVELVRSFARCTRAESTTNSQCPNLLVLVSDVKSAREYLPYLRLRQVYRDALSSSEIICFFAPFETGRKQISSAFIFVSAGLEDAMQRTCLQEEIWQSFGLYNDISGSKLFSFNNAVVPKKLTKYDRGLLQALYDPRVKPGYPVGLVMEIFINNMAAKADQ